jgi:hypothetical protein
VLSEMDDTQKSFSGVAAVFLTPQRASDAPEGVRIL